MSDFSILNKMASFAKENHLPVYKIAMYLNGEVREAEVIPASRCNDIYSVSKNFTATAVGMCIDDGILSLDDTVFDIFKDTRPHMNPLWKEVTVERVLSQTVGIDGMFLDIDTEDVFTYKKSDWLDVVLEHPFVTKPGERFAYSDSNFYLASRIVARATGHPMQRLLEERLFTPLKMQGWAWSTCPLGHAMGGSGLFIETRDMAKFGAVYLNGGELYGVRVVSEDFVHKATSVISNYSHKGGYGLSFWISEDGSGNYHCGGAFNQKIHIRKTDNYVLAWQAHDDMGTVDMLNKML